MSTPCGVYSSTTRACSTTFRILFSPPLPSISAPGSLQTNTPTLTTFSTACAPSRPGGEFNHRSGGQIYLKQLNLVIDFPSGATVLIPSAFVDHGNTPIADGETRYSITQYAAGGLFRWVKYGFQSAKSVLASVGGAKLVAAFDGVPGSRWEWALSLFSEVDQLEADREAVFGQDYYK
jgi:hypothetical protein